MRRLHLALPFLLTVSSASLPSNARAIKLDWGSVNLLLAADSSRGTLLWAASRVPKKEQAFIAYFEPAAVHSWTQALREFLTLSLTSADTGSIRTSPVLRSNAGDGIYFVRIKFEGRWTDERLIVMQGPSPKSGQLLIEGTEQNAIEFLEGLESTNIQALSMPRTVAVDSIPILNPIDSVTCPIVQKDPPRIRYPVGERIDGKGGEVWLSYVVTSTGVVDPTSFEAILSDGRAFESSVRDALVRTRFTPAQRNGAPISIRVFQQFTFRVTSCKGNEFGSSRAALFVPVSCSP